MPSPLTDAKIKAAIKAATKDTTLNDGTSGKGLGSLRLRIRPSTRPGEPATAGWLAHYERAGQRHKAMIGIYPHMSLKDARETFNRDFRDVLAAGGTPKTRADIAETVALSALAPENPRTVERLFQGYVASMRAKGRKTADDVENVLLLKECSVAAAFSRSRPAADITPADVSALLAPIFERGSRRMADITRSYVSAAFNWGMSAGHNYTVPEAERVDWGIVVNPTDAVTRDSGASKPRERNLSAHEINMLWNDSCVEFAGFTDAMGQLLRLLLLCGQRVLETIRVDGADINLEAALWVIPAHKTKMGVAPHAVPLPPAAVAIFRDLIDQHGDGPLFPSATGKTGMIGICSVGRAVARWCDDNKVPRFQPRDLRRTWKSRAGDGAKIQKHLRDLIQQHAKTDTSGKHYDHADYLPDMVEAMRKWGDWLGKVVKAPPPVRAIAA